MTRAAIVLLVLPCLVSCGRAAAPPETQTAAVAQASEDQPVTTAHLHTPPASELQGPITEQEALRVCEHYRRAVEARDIEALLALVSPDYYEDGGTPDKSDDLDAAGMRSYLTRTFGEAQGIRYEIELQQVVPEGDRARIRFTYRAEYSVAGSQSTRRVDADEMTIERRDGKLLILSGM